MISIPFSVCRYQNPRLVDFHIRLSFRLGLGKSNQRSCLAEPQICTSGSALALTCLGFLDIRERVLRLFLFDCTGKSGNFHLEA